MAKFPPNIGHLGFLTGTHFNNRQEMSTKRIHGPIQSGIWNDGSEYAVSIVVSGGYVDDYDDFETILYTGQGGRDPVSGRQIKDQELTRGNKGLFNSMKFKYPVRVSRGYQVESGPAKGYRYDGLYLVKSARIEHSVNGPMIWRFVLEKLEQESFDEQIPNEKEVVESNSLKLNKSVYLVTKRFGKLNIWKSCPQCSKLNTEEIEFKLFVQCDEDDEWNYASSDFGFSNKRETITNPLGGQSLCKVCRSGKRLSGLTRTQLKGEIICSGNWNEIDKSF
jgi:hypothetical protein